MKILHTEASNGWGGQEMRILRESEGMRKRGHEVIFAITEGGILATKARESGFTVYEFPIDRKHTISAFRQFRKVIKDHKIDIVNTHSSLDAWIAGLAGKTCGVKVIRTRHLSGHIRPGLNSKILYGWLADAVVTTCEAVAEVIRRQANLTHERCLSIPTGVDPERVTIENDAAECFRNQHNISTDTFIAGTTCILRSWKGVTDLLKAAKVLENEPNLKWLIVGDGPCTEKYKQECADLDLNDRVIFTGHLDLPYPAMGAMDLFLLLSTGNEGVSQATLQAGYLSKPMITTRTGGLPEVCVEGKTGFNVDNHAPEQVADSVKQLIDDSELRSAFSKNIHKLVVERFTYDAMLDQMEEIYQRVK